MTSPPTTRPSSSWPAIAANARQAPGASGRTSNLITEAAVALLVTAYSTLLGAVLGLVWPRLAPHVQLIRAIDGSEAAAKAVLGDDMWFALLGLVAGVVSVAILLLAAGDAGRGPGGVLGLAVGGFLGSLVAAHIGIHVQQPDPAQQQQTAAVLRHIAPGITQHQIDGVVNLFSFRVRANAVLVAWPIAAVILHAAAVISRYLRIGPEA
jgi:hypothetical protein